MNQICIKAPRILLPADADMSKWAVIACDQFTSNREYWRKLNELVGDAPSTLRLIFPEAYLKDEPEKRIKSIKATMRDYAARGVFKKLNEGFVLVERQTPYTYCRYGIMLSVDLEKYSFERAAKTQIRASEATIVDRLPPRIKIREGAEMEFPHIMLLYDDAENVVLNRLLAQKSKLEKLYDVDLNMSGGNVKGYFISDYESTINDFASLLDARLQTEKYGANEGLLFAVGDGNHSLATAKSCWERLKGSLSEQERETHPARFALCEAVNIYDAGLTFEPIHRIVKSVDAKAFCRGLNFNGAMESKVVTADGEKIVRFGDTVPESIVKLDGYIASYIGKNGGEVDYIHGDNDLLRLSQLPDSVGILLPAINKGDFFKNVALGGSFPKKTFSMGEGVEKRYYIEGKEIK